MMDRRAILAGATTLAGAAALAEVAAAQNPAVIPVADRSDKKRIFMVHLVAEFDMVNETDGAAANVQKHLKEELRKSIEGFSLRTIAGVRVADLQVAEVRE
jgi:hypothetical protein